VKPSPWYRSLYWRIGVSFVVFVLAVVVIQGVIFRYQMQRAAIPSRSPNNIAAVVAADVGSAMAEQPGLDLQDYVAHQYGREMSRIYVVMKDGRTARNAAEPLDVEIQRSIGAALSGVNPVHGRDAPGVTGPVVTAPIQLGNELMGMVVLPPPPLGGASREVGRFLSIPGIALLLAATVMAAIVIFTPARRRLRSLESAAERLGAGDLSARAPDGGADEIARVARAFNHMASELASRDEALRTSDRLRRQLFADVSHELKTPLTAMRGYLETLRMASVDVDAETRERYLDTVQRETRRLERIVTDLLDLARYENGVGSIDVRLFAVERLFAHVISRHDQEASARGITLVSGIAPAADQLTADPDRIEQVIENLVANALRHTPPGGTVQLRATVNGARACLSVIDSGSGIDPSHVAHVFDRFYKVDAARAAGAGGSGLGLSIAKAIVDRHGGSIGVTSVPGRTEFKVELPQSPGDLHAAAS
jgi:signal transduction histidine kinase